MNASKLNVINERREDGGKFTAEFQYTETTIDGEVRQWTEKVTFTNAWNQDADTYAREASGGGVFCRVISYHAE